MFIISVLDVDKLLADSLAKVAAYDVDKLFSKASTISKGVVLNIHHSLLKEWGADSLGVLPEDTMQQLLMEVRAARPLLLPLCGFSSIL